jgi:Skp family chaperone for outer membrane proteins
LKVVWTRLDGRRHMTMRWTLIGALLALSACGAGADLEIAVVDMEQLLKAHPDTEAAEATLEQQAKEFESEAKELVQELRDLKEEYDGLREEAESTALSEKARREKAEVAQAKRQILKDKQRMIRETGALRQKQFADQRRRMMMRIRLDLRNMVEEHVGKKYTLVLDSSAVGLSGVRAVVFSAKEVDITEALLERVRKKKSR